MSKTTAYSFEEFNLDAAIDGRSSSSTDRGFKLPGTENIRAIYNSRSTSTEEFVIGAVEALGQANRNLMFANMSLEGFEDRLNIAARVAKNVKIARDRGLEGFENTKPLNPIVYALEAEKGESVGQKVGGFFKRVAQAIVSAARHIITMIANFIKMIVNKIREFAQSGYSKKYKEYCALNGKAKKAADSVSIKSMKWNTDSTDMCATMAQLTKNYTNLVSGSIMAGALDTVRNLTGKLSKIPIVGLAAKGIDSGARILEVKTELAKINKNIEEIDNIRKTGAIFNGILKFEKGEKGKGGSQNIHVAFYDGDKPVQMTCKDIREVTDDFKILSEQAMTDFTKALAAGKQAQTTASKSCKDLDKLANELKKEHKDADTVALKKAVARLATRKLSLDSYIQSIYLEAQSTRLRYTHTAYLAMKQYLKTGDLNTKVTRGNESYSQIDVDDLFANL